MCFCLQLPLECEDPGCSLLFIESQLCLWLLDAEGIMSMETCYVTLWFTGSDT